MVAELVGTYGTKISRNDMMAVSTKYGINPGFLTVNKIGRGLYDISSFSNSAAVSTS